MEISMTIIDLYSGTEEDVTESFDSIADFKQFIENRIVPGKASDGIIVNEDQIPLPEEFFMADYAACKLPCPFRFRLLNRTQNIEVHRIRENGRTLFSSGKYEDPCVDLDLGFQWPKFHTTH